jgi:hypothetical protein
MSIRTGIVVAAGLFAAVGLAGSASAEMFAPSKAAKPKKVTVTGCASSVGMCTMLKAGKASYNVSSANPAVPTGKRVKVQGMTSDKMSPCGGTVLDNIKFANAKGKCPK